jgi:hypothetical protein
MDNIDKISNEIEAASGGKLQKAFDKVTEHIMTKYSKALARKGRYNVHLEPFLDELQDYLKKAFNDIYTASALKFGRGSSRAQTLSFYSSDLQFTNQWRNSIKRLKALELEYLLNSDKYRILQQEYEDKTGIFAKKSLKVNHPKILDEERSR